MNPYIEKVVRILLVLVLIPYVLFENFIISIYYDFTHNVLTSDNLLEIFPFLLGLIEHFVLLVYILPIRIF